MTTTQETWAAAADRLAALALKLKLHTEEELADSGVSLADIGDKISAAISGAAEALADACKDEAIRQDLRDAGAAISDAVSSSFESAKRAVRARD